MSLTEDDDYVTATDRVLILERCEGKCDLTTEVGMGVGWAKPWDCIMDLGT